MLIVQPDTTDVKSLGLTIEQVDAWMERHVKHGTKVKIIPVIRTSRGSRSRVGWRKTCYAFYANKYDVTILEDRLVDRQWQSGYEIEEQFQDAIEYVREIGGVFLTTEYRRYSRDLELLAKYGKGVPFLTVLPTYFDLKLDPKAREHFLNAKAHELATYWIKKTDPNARFGRLPKEISGPELTTILNTLGTSHRATARMMQGWTDKRVARVREWFPYQPINS